MIYRVIIRSGKVDLWFDFLDIMQANKFLEAAKLQNVPNNPKAYADVVDDIIMRPLTIEEQKTQMRAFDGEDVSQYAE